MQARRSILVAAGLLAVAATSAQAGSLRFTIDGPGVQTTQVTQGTPVTYDFGPDLAGDAWFPDLSVGSTTDTTVGRYTVTAVGPSTSPQAGSAVFQASAVGGAGGAGRYLAQRQADLTLDFLAAGPGEAVGYFGFWWSAGDGQNQLIVNMADGSSTVFSTQSIIGSPNLQTTGGPAGFGHYGNPNTAFLGQNPGEAYAFVNIYAQDAGSKITSLVFRETRATGAFETDNHTYIVDLINTGDQTGDPVAETPVPATALLLGAGLGLIGWTRRRRRAGE
jgi:hypothetical protein